MKYHKQRIEEKNSEEYIDIYVCVPDPEDKCYESAYVVMDDTMTSHKEVTIFACNNNREIDIYTPYINPSTIEKIEEITKVKITSRIAVMFIIDNLLEYFRGPRTLISIIECLKLCLAHTDYHVSVEHILSNLLMTYKSNSEKFKWY